MPIDINLLSFNGPQDNAKTVTLNDVTAPDGDASALKCSTGLRNFVLNAGTVTGGRDACLDVNNLCENIEAHIAVAIAGGQFVSTVKGGSKNVAVHVGVIQKRGTVCEHIFGDWSDQSREWTTGSILDSKMADGSPVRVIVLASEFPVEAPGSGPYRYMYVKPWFPHWVHALIVWGFHTLRNWGFFRSEAPAT